MSSKESFKMSLVNQIMNEKEMILPLLIETNAQKWQGVYHSNIYRDSFR